MEAAQVSNGPQPTGDELLIVDDVKKHFPVKQGFLRRTAGQLQAVDGVDLDVRRGETVGLVGESGCGKTTIGLALLGLLPVGGKVVGGSIRLDGREVSRLSDEELRRLRGDRIGIVFQDPLTSLNPTMTIGDQVGDIAASVSGRARRW